MSQYGKVGASAGAAVIVAVLLGLVASVSFPSGAPAMTSTITSAASASTSASTSTMITTSTGTATSGFSSSVSSATEQSSTTPVTSASTSMSASSTGTATVTTSTTTTSVASASTSMTVSSTTTVTFTTSTATISESTTTTAGCTGPNAAGCGGVQIIDASLVVVRSLNSADGPGSNLNLTIQNTGNLASVALTITLSRVVMLNATFLWAPGNLMTCSVFIPSSQLSVTAGSTYQLEADVFYGTNNLPNHIWGDAVDIVNVTAT